MREVLRTVVSPVRAGETVHVFKTFFDFCFYFQLRFLFSAGFYFQLRFLFSAGFYFQQVFIFSRFYFQQVLFLADFYFVFLVLFQIYSVRFHLNVVYILYTCFQ